MSTHIMIGSRETFGIELTVTHTSPGIWADVLLWIGGESLGTDEDAFAIHPLLGTLDGLLKRASEDAATQELLGLPANSAWERCAAAGRKYCVDTSYLFDRYEVFCVSSESTVRFLWSSRELDPSVIHDASGSRGDLVRAFAELRAVYERLCGTG
jgi:hypothetical protein